MNYKLIPNKNRVFENEKFFLENKYKNGLALEKKGIIFYKFTPVTPKDVTYEIDLLPRTLSNEELQLKNWDIITTKRVCYKDLVKVYYFNRESTARLLIDEKIRLDYYNYKKILFIIASSVSILPVLLAYIFAIALKPISTLLLYKFLPLICLFVYTLRYAIIFEQGFENLNTKLGNTDDISSNAHYIVKFSNLTSQQLSRLEEGLSNLGTTRKINNNIYRIESPLSEEYLLEEISSFTNIKENNISVTHVGSLYFFM